MPVQVFAEEEDPGITVEDAQMMAAGIPRAEEEEVSNARHLLNWDAEGFFTEALVGRLEGVV